MDKVFKLQKKALRIISNSHYLSHSAPLFKEYNLLNVYDTYELELTSFMYKHFTGQLPGVFNDYFTKHIDIKCHRYSTRKTEDYKVCRSKTEFANKTMRNIGPKKWNSIHENIKTSKSIKTFRSNIKENLMSNYI